MKICWDNIFNSDPLCEISFYLYMSVVITAHPDIFQKGNLDSYNSVKVVMGNQSCDLDSAVCALVYAYDLAARAKDENANVAVIPMMNVPKREFSLKTEVLHHLKKYNIPVSSLIFSDELDLQKLQDDGKLQVILVDHHTPSPKDVPFASSVVEIIDHHPQDPEWLWPEIKMNLETVGSCASLIGRKLLNEKSNILNSQTCSLLRGPILVDTANLLKEANRATPTDVKVLKRLEEIGRLELNREQEYNELLHAKTDISSLTPDDLLIKDLKIINSIPIAGLPILVQKFFTIDGVFEALYAFTKKYECAVTIVMGMDLTNNVVTRDIAVYSLHSSELSNRIIEVLTTNTDPTLDLTQILHTREADYSLVLFKQGNIRASRKQVVPIIHGIPVNCEFQK